MAYDIRPQFKLPTKPATPTHELLRELYEDQFKAKCKHRDLAEAFLGWLATGNYREYRFKPNEHYGILTDAGNWVEFKRYTGTVKPTERVTKAFLHLKGGYNYAKWGMFLDTFRPLFKLVTIPTGESAKGYFYTIVELNSGERFELTSKVYSTQVNHNPAAVAETVEYDTNESYDTMDFD